MTFQKPATGSLQDLLKKRRQENFFGRREEVDFFVKNINSNISNRKFIINIYGQGGIGKTTLVKNYIKIIDDKEGVSLYSDEVQNTVIDILINFKSSLQKRNISANKFYERVEKYLELIEKIEGDPDLPSNLSSIVGQAIGKFGISFLKNIPGASMAVDFVGEKNIIEKTGELASYITKKLGNKDEVNLVLNPIEVLTPLFLEAINNLSKKKQILIVFDTFEFTQNKIESWLIKLFEGKYGEITLNTFWIISGRNKLDSNWSSFYSLCSFLSLEPLSVKEAKELLIQKGITDQKTIELILELSQCIPLWLATLSSQKDLGEVLSPTDEAIERFLKWSPDPNIRWGTIVCSLPKSFNKDIVEILTIKNEKEDLFTWLKKQPFTKQNTEGEWTYHEIVRKIMLKSFKTDSANLWNQANNSLVEYYKVSKSNNYKNKQNLILYHSILKQDESALQLIIFELLDSIISNDNHGLLSGLQTTINEANHILEDIKVAQIKDAVELFITNFHYGGFNKQALEILTNFESIIKKDPEHLSKIYYLKSEILYRENKYEKALSAIDEGIKINPSESIFHDKRSDINISLKNFEEAIKDLKNAIKLNPIDPEYYYSISKIYRFYIEDLAAAMAFANKTIEINDVSPEYYSYRAKLFNKLGDYKSELNDLTYAVQFAKDPMYLHDRAKYFERNNNYESALNDYSKALELEKRKEYSYADRASFFYRNNEFDKAIEDYDNAIKMKVNEISKTHSSTTELKFKIGDKVLYVGRNNWHELKADILQEQEKFEDAIKNYKEELQFKSVNLNDKGRILFKISRIYFYHIKDKEKFKENIEDSINASSTFINNTNYEHSDLPETLFYRGVSYMLQEKYDLAHEDFDKGLKYDSQNANLIFYKAISLYNDNKKDEAIILLENLLKLHTIESEWVHDRLISWYINDERYSDAIKINNLILDKKPNDLLVNFKKLALNFKLLGRNKVKSDLEKIEQMIRQEFKDKSPKKEINYFLAGVHLIKNELQKTYQLLDELINHDSSIIDDIREDFLFETILNTDEFNDLVEKYIKEK